MTANAHAQQPQGTARLPGADEAYEVRLATRIPRPLDQRLRLLAVLSRKPITQVLTELLARALPTAEELAEQMHRRSGTDER